jgi:hypothetical protein
MERSGGDQEKIPSDDAASKRGIPTNGDSFNSRVMQRQHAPNKFRRQFRLEIELPARAAVCRCNCSRFALQTFLSARVALARVLRGASPGRPPTASRASRLFSFVRQAMRCPLHPSP